VTAGRFAHLIGYVVLTAALVAGCGATSFLSSDGIQSRPCQVASPPASPITRSQAIEVASAHVESGAKALSVTATTFGGLMCPAPTESSPVDAGIASDRLLWAVAFTDVIAICPPDGGPCKSPRPAMTTVLLDYLTGEFLSSSTQAAAP
jgi:hypothetical protein